MNRDVQNLLLLETEVSIYVHTFWLNSLLITDDNRTTSASTLGHHCDGITFAAVLVRRSIPAPPAMSGAYTPSVCLARWSSFEKVTQRSVGLLGRKRKKNRLY